MDKKLIIFIIVVLVLLALLFVLHKYKRTIFHSGKPNAVTAAIHGGASNQTADAPSLWPLKIGSIGPEVKNLQQVINRFYITIGLNSPLDETGKLDQATEDATTKFLSGSKTVSEEQYKRYVSAFIVKDIPVSIPSPSAIQPQNANNSQDEYNNALDQPADEESFVNFFNSTFAGIPNVGK